MTEWEKYYYAGTVRLAMREDSNNPLYLIGDHLGSTSLVIDTSGQEAAKRSYLPFGETWGVSATELPTDYTYTGQQQEYEIGLDYYVARWYAPDSLSGIQPHQAYARVRKNPARSLHPPGQRRARRGGCPGVGPVRVCEI